MIHCETGSATGNTCQGSYCHRGLRSRCSSCCTGGTWSCSGTHFDCCTSHHICLCRIWLPLGGEKKDTWDNTRVHFRIFYRCYKLESLTFTCVNVVRAAVVVTLTGRVTLTGEGAVCSITTATHTWVQGVWESTGQIHVFMALHWKDIYNYIKQLHINL